MSDFHIHIPRPREFKSPQTFSDASTALDNGCDYLRLTQLCHDKENDRSVSKVALGLKNNSTCLGVSFSECKVGEATLMILKDVVQTNYHLRFLDLSRNKVQASDLRVFLSGLLENIVLEALVLSHMELKNSGAKVVARFLEKNPLLRYLDISSNKIMDKGAEALYNAMNTNTNLVDLILRKNGISDETEVSLALRARQNQKNFKEKVQETLSKVNNVSYVNWDRSRIVVLGGHSKDKVAFMRNLLGKPAESLSLKAESDVVTVNAPVSVSKLSSCVAKSTHQADQTFWNSQTKFSESSWLAMNEIDLVGGKLEPFHLEKFKAQRNKLSSNDQSFGFYVQKFSSASETESIDDQETCPQTPETDFSFIPRASFEYQQEIGCAEFLAAEQFQKLQGKNIEVVDWPLASASNFDPFFLSGCDIMMITIDLSGFSLLNSKSERDIESALKHFRIKEHLEISKKTKLCIVFLNLATRSTRSNLDLSLIPKAKSKSLNPRFDKKRGSKPQSRSFKSSITTLRAQRNRTMRESLTKPQRNTSPPNMEAPDVQSVNILLNGVLNKLKIHPARILSNYQFDVNFFPVEKANGESIEQIRTSIHHDLSKKTARDSPIPLSYVFFHDVFHSKVIDKAKKKSSMLLTDMSSIKREADGFINTGCMTVKDLQKVCWKAGYRKEKKFQVLLETMRSKGLIWSFTENENMKNVFIVNMEEFVNSILVLTQRCNVEGLQYELVQKRYLDDDFKFFMTTGLISYDLLEAVVGKKFVNFYVGFLENFYYLNTYEIKDMKLFAIPTMLPAIPFEAPAKGFCFEVTTNTQNPPAAMIDRVLNLMFESKQAVLTPDTISPFVDFFKKSTVKISSFIFKDILEISYKEGSNIVNLTFHGTSARSFRVYFEITGRKTERIELEIVSQLVNEVILMVQKTLFHDKSSKIKERFPSFEVDPLDLESEDLSKKRCCEIKVPDSEQHWISIEDAQRQRIHPWAIGKSCTEKHLSELKGKIEDLEIELMI